MNSRGRCLDGSCEPKAESSDLKCIPQGSADTSHVHVLSLVHNYVAAAGRWMAGRGRKVPPGNSVLVSGDTSTISVSASLT